MKPSWIAQCQIQTLYDQTSGSDVQPRCNQHLSATWAVSQRAAHDGDLHVLTQGGAYRRLTTSGATLSNELVLSLGFVVGRQGWSDLDNRDVSGAHIDLTAGAEFLANPNAYIRLTNYSPFGIPLTQVGTGPWAPINSLLVFYEGQGPSVLGPSGYNHVANWFQDEVSQGVFEGFATHRFPGCIVDKAGGEKEVWYWSGRGIGQDTEWGNVVEGYRVQPPSGSSAIVDGVWAATKQPQSGVPTERLNLRSQTTGLAVMNQQAIHAENLSDGRTALMLGCPGGSLRVIVPGDMRDGDQTEHDLVYDNEDWSSADLGFGGAALAVRSDGQDEFTIWLGTLEHPCARPGALAAGSMLADGEVATGAVHRFKWVPGGAPTLHCSKVLYPNTTGVARGGYGVVGMARGDVLGDAQDEVVVGTLAGELIVLDASLNHVLWRATLPGSVGNYNSISVADLDGVPGNEIYVSGSFGIWRFK